jgi:hypothetical protein
LNISDISVTELVFQLAIETLNDPQKENILDIFVTDAVDVPSFHKGTPLLLNDGQSENIFDIFVTPVTSHPEIVVATTPLVLVIPLNRLHPENMLDRSVTDAGIPDGTDTNLSAPENAEVSDVSPETAGLVLNAQVSALSVATCVTRFDPVPILNEVIDPVPVTFDKTIVTGLLLAGVLTLNEFIVRDPMDVPFTLIKQLREYPGVPVKTY